MPPQSPDDPRLRPSQRRAVVKILSSCDAPDYDQPWQTQGVEQATGSGVVVKTSRGLRVLTNAHVIEHSVFIEARRFGRSRKYIAEAEGVDFECDLALLRVDDDGFFGGTDPLELGDLPALAERVTVLGFPIGGERLSVTEGVVSRIEMSGYAQSQRRLLAIQIDAAINAGNSGGPVLRNGSLAGIAFQALDDAENIGYVIAAPVVRHFLDDLEDGRLDGFPDLGIVTQPLESEAHRRALDLPGDRDGILVTQTVFEGTSWGVLRRGDVLLSVDGTPVASDGTVPFRRGTRIDVEYIAAQRHVGDEIDATVWRAGAQVECRLKLEAPRPLVPESRRDVRPGYLLYAGLLFVPLTGDFLRTWGEDWEDAAPGHLMSLYEVGIRTRARQDVVVLQKVLADDVNRGYHDLQNLVIRRVQGRRVRCAGDLIKILGGAQEPYVHFEAEDGTQIVVDRELAVLRRDEIMFRYGVPHETSEGLPDGCAAG